MCLIFHIECVWWLLIVASALTNLVTVQHLQNNKILIKVLVSDVAATFKSSMSTVLIFCRVSPASN